MKSGVKVRVRVGVGVRAGTVLTMCCMFVCVCVCVHVRVHVHVRVRVYVCEQMLMQRSGAGWEQVYQGKSRTELDRIYRVDREGRIE